jgi:hypothetical protein
MNNGTSKEDYSKWIIFGIDGNTYVGKPDVEDLYWEEVLDGAPMQFSVCYQITVHAIPMQQGGNVSLAMQHFVATPGNLPVDAEFNGVPNWCISGSDPKIAASIEKYVKMAKLSQDQLRAAASGVALR